MANLLRILRAVSLLVSFPVVCAKNATIINPRIVGGQIAKLGQFPYQAAIVNIVGNDIICGAAVLSPDYIVTAAHCFYMNNRYKDPHNMYEITVGHIVLHNSNERISSQIEKVFMYPEYVYNNPGYDIALVKLKNKFPVEQGRVEMIAMARSSPQTGTDCTVSGWGKVAYYGPVSNTLRLTHVKVYDYAQCVEDYKDLPNFPRPNHNTPGVICAADPNFKSDACQGDSGGPLICNGVLSGVVSVGFECAKKNFPGIYTDVAYYSKWIEDIIYS